MIINCPNCQERFQVLAKPLESRPLAGSSIHESSTVTPKVMRAVEEFVDELGAGRHTNRALHSNYSAQQLARGWPAVSRVALGKALKRLGATPWRDAVDRGYDIPEQTHDLITKPKVDWRDPALPTHKSRRDIPPIPMDMELPPGFSWDDDDA